MIDKKLEKAMRVLVPFGKGNKASVAFVYDIIKDIDADYEIKDIISIIDDNKLISDELLDLAFYMTKTYLSPIQLSLKQVMPPTKIEKIKTFYRSKSNKNDEFLSFLNSYRSKDEILKIFPDSEEKLKDLVDKDELSVIYEASDKIKVSYDTYIKLNNGDISLAKNAVKQRLIIDYLKKYGTTKQSTLLKNTASSRSSIKSLLDKGVIEEKFKESRKDNDIAYNNYEKHTLNEEQSKAFKKLKNKSDGMFLLFGVTGSGKTEIFLQLVEDVIKKGKEAIILVPEISLTPQTIEMFSGRFKEKIAIIHSRLTPREKFDQWRMINNGEVKIAIGARSAIFAPFKNLGAIIIDEEHDKSYVSSKDPKYHTKEIAKFRANYHSCNLVMASATPSVETMKEVKDGKLDILHLKTRVNNIMPEISLVDMREELKNSNYSMLSFKLQEEIRRNLKNKEQTILFLNKIGHDSFTFCRSCGYVVKCDACDVAMTYHKNVDKLVCHYCGRTKNQVKICPNCHSKKIKEFGAGTEKLEEEVRKLFPDANIMRMDSMIATSKSKYEHMYRAMKSGEIDILLGTQMIAKGLDFDNVTLVGIISADLSLNIGDFSAQETSFQLLTQVSGRAGRSIKPGRSLVQTYNPENFVIQAVKSNDYISFFNSELKIRQAFSYPPFKNMVTIRIVNKNRIKTVNISKKLAHRLRKAMLNFGDIEIIGPNPCKISRINNKYRYNILIKVSNDDLGMCRETIARIRNAMIEKYKDTSIIVAINPVNID